MTFTEKLIFGHDPHAIPPLSLASQFGSERVLYIVVQYTSLEIGSYWTFLHPPILIPVPISLLAVANRYQGAAGRRRKKKGSARDFIFN